MKFKRFWLFLATALSVFIPTSGQTKDLSVVTSIRPVHSLVSAVMGDAAKPYLMIGGGESPHTYVMKTSDARALQTADVIFWMGRDFETFLEKAIVSLSPNAEIVTLSQAANLVRLTVREGGVWEKHTHESAQDGGDHVNNHGLIDMHMWLDPENAIAMVEAIAAALIRADGGNTEIYRRNADRTIDRLKILSERISLQLSGLEKRPFIQFHDAFQYLEHRFSLNVVGSITLNPERQIGASRIRSIRDHIVKEQVVCIFTEPQFEPKLVETITEGLETKVSSLDPIGVDIAPGSDLYFVLMSRNADALKSCLAN
ncbi:MAG: zinc ABC transporter substrate-binding protein [Fimbriimonadaceae bacterium]|nr:zinc ABC transporter substrate-binding protein [Alphaproteobacteria bacterium]